MAQHEAQDSPPQRLGEDPLKPKHNYKRAGNGGHSSALEALTHPRMALGAEPWPDFWGQMVTCGSFPRPGGGDGPLGKIRPWGLAERGNVSNVVDGSLAMSTLVLNTLKGPQEAVVKLVAVTCMDFDDLFCHCFLCCFVIVFQGVLGASWGFKSTEVSSFP